MKVQVPARAIGLNYTDRYMVFIHFMWKLMRKEGKRTAFYFFAKDVKKILKESDDPHMHRLQSKLSPVFEVAILNPFSLRIRWKPSDIWEGKTGVILTEWVEIEDRDALNFYWYLLARFQDPTIVDDKPILYTGEERDFNNVVHRVYQLLEK